MKKSKLLLTSTALLSAVSIAPVLSGCSNSLSASKKVASTTFVYDKILYETITSNTCRVVKYVGDKPTGALSIPDTVIDSTPQLYTVTEIGPRAFESCTGLTSVSFAPDSHITKIGAKAFNYCKKLTSVTNCISLTTIDEFAFKSCAALQSIDLPQSIATIGDGAFEGCKALNSLTGHEGINVKTIGLSAFRGCSTLSTLPTMNSLENIGASAFRECAALTSFAVSSTCKSIGELAFANSGMSSLSFTTNLYWYVKGTESDLQLFKPDKTSATQSWTNYKEMMSNELVLCNPVTEINITSPQDSAYSGETFQCSAKTNSDATIKNLSWNSSDSSVASVDDTGKVTFWSTPKAAAKVTLTVSANDGSGYKETIDITNKGSPIQSIVWNTQHGFCFTGEDQTFKATITTKAEAVDEKYTKVIYEVLSLDDEVTDLATIDENGKLVANPDTTKYGVVKVIAKSAYDTSKILSMEVSVNTIFDVRYDETTGDRLWTCKGFCPYWDLDKTNTEIINKINELFPSTGYLKLPDEVEYITEKAFSYFGHDQITKQNISTTKVDLSNLTKCKKTGEKVFEVTDANPGDINWYLTELKLPPNLTEISSEFCGYQSLLTGISIPYTVTQIWYSAFCNSNALQYIEWLKGPNGEEPKIEKIREWSFSAKSGIATHLTEITIPYTCNWIAYGSFVNRGGVFANAYFEDKEHYWVNHEATSQVLISIADLQDSSTCATRILNIPGGKAAKKIV